MRLLLLWFSVRLLRVVVSLMENDGQMKCKNDSNPAVGDPKRDVGRESICFLTTPFANGVARNIGTVTELESAVCSKVAVPTPDSPIAQIKGALNDSSKKIQEKRDPSLHVTRRSRVECSMLQCFATD
ncbi:hypothetical protein [Xanthomonas melonis]|uniref:hypothetical protein n=1 Tax=Xanthomonas melonis TaxID=56456 RepID=UPI00142E7471|nr:hypothetical protein [Xanthomonas melonis]